MAETSRFSLTSLSSAIDKVVGFDPSVPRDADQMLDVSLHDDDDDDKRQSHKAHDDDAAANGDAATGGAADDDRPKTVASAAASSSTATAAAPTASELERLRAALAARDAELARLKAAGASGNGGGGANARDDDADARMAAMREEFSKRLGTFQTKLAAAQRERDALRRELDNDEHRHAYKEREAECAALRSEGEKLSVKIGQLEATVRRVRKEKADAEHEAAAARTRAEQSEALLERKTTRIKALERAERETSETVAAMQELAKRTARQLERKTADAEALEKRASELEFQLEAAWRELTGVRKERADAEERVARLVQEAESRAASTSAREAATRANDAAQREQALQAALDEARATLAREAERAEWREQELRRELAALTARVHAAEERNTTFVASIPDATRPLLRQIDVLQAAHASRQEVWEALEQSLQARIRQEEARATAAATRVHAAEAAAREATRRVEELERALASADEEAAARVARVRSEATEATQAAARAQRELAEARAAHDEALHAERTAATTRVAELETALRRAQTQLADARSLAQRLRANAMIGGADDDEGRRRGGGDQAQEAAATTTTAAAAAASEAAAAAAAAAAGGGAPDDAAPSVSHADIVRGLRAQEELEAHRQGNLMAGGERLTQLLRQRDGETASLMAQADELRRTVRNLEEELVALTSKNVALEARAAELEATKAAQAQLDARFSLALDLLGEKEERVAELLMDLADVKQVYRTQVLELLERCESLERVVESLKSSLKE